ncbi:MAG: hypothetical protein IJ430_07300 [Parabacteroides sp.]|nr:hypothetical protein [Parabacteroides sp.]
MSPKYKSYEDAVSEDNNSVLCEEISLYQNQLSKEFISTMSMAEALKHAMPLEESRRIIMERIHKDFPNYVI